MVVAEELAHYKESGSASAGEKRSSRALGLPGVVKLFENEKRSIIDRCWSAGVPRRIKDAKRRRAVKETRNSAYTWSICFLSASNFYLRPSRHDRWGLVIVRVASACCSDG